MMVIPALKPSAWKSPNDSAPMSESSACQCHEAAFFECALGVQLCNWSSFVLKVLGQQLSQDTALQVITCFEQWVQFGALHMDDVPYDAAGNLIGRTFELLKGECTPTNSQDPSLVYIVLACQPLRRPSS
jgi:hypothetical protein